MWTWYETLPLDDLFYGTQATTNKDDIEISEYIENLVNMQNLNGISSITTKK